MTFQCSSTSGCVKKRFGLDGECKAVTYLNPRLCHLGDPQSDIYNPSYEEYLKDVPKEEVETTINLAPRPEPGLLDKIIECPHRSLFTSTTDANGVVISNHVYRDGTAAEGCGCGKMRCKLGKGQGGNVSLDDCKACISEQEAVVTPTLLQKAKSLTTAIVKHVAAGLPVISDEAKERRLSICGGCVHNNNGTCRACGCLLSAKVALPHEQCPLNPPKWNSEAV